MTSSLAQLKGIRFFYNFDLSDHLQMRAEYYCFFAKFSRSSWHEDFHIEIEFCLYDCTRFANKIDYKTSLRYSFQVFSFLNYKEITCL